MPRGLAAYDGRRVPAIEEAHGDSRFGQAGVSDGEDEYLGVPQLAGMCELERVEFRVQLRSHLTMQNRGARCDRDETRDAKGWGKGPMKLT